MKNFTISMIIMILVMGFSTNAIAQEEELKVDLQEARVIGNQLHFDLVVTNQANDAEYMIMFSNDNIKLYDGTGEIFDPTSITFGQDTKTFGVLAQKCLQEIPVKMKIVFSGAPSKLETVNTLVFNMFRKEDDKKFPFKLSKIDIPTTNEPEVVKAHEDPLYFEVEPEVFAQMTEAKRNGNILTIKFMVLNKGSDKEVGFSFNGTRIIDDKGNTMDLEKMNFSGMVKTYGVCSKEMPRGIPMKLEYQFELTDPSAEKIMMFEFTKSGNVFQIRDIDL